MVKSGKKRWRVSKWINKNPTITALVAISAIVGVVLAIVLAVIDHIPPDPNVTVCESIEEFELKSVGSAADDERYGTDEQRAFAAEQLARSSDRSGLQDALEQKVAVYDELALLSTSNLSSAEQTATWFDRMAEAQQAVLLACASLGVEFVGLDIAVSADGSISHDDAVLFCEGALTYLQALATSTVDDPRVLQAAIVLTNRADTGLPVEVYSATRELLAAYAAALQGSGYPGDAPSQTVGSFCASQGAPGWSAFAAGQDNGQ